MVDRAYCPRLVERTLREILGGLPAVMVVGPRGVGKTTTARRQARTIVRLDRELEATPFRSDPDTVLASLDPPVLLDEWQLVPEVLASVKRAVDDEPGPGRFLLTGSVRADLLAPSWAATGRVVRVTMWGLSQRELVGDITRDSFFDRVFAGEVASLKPPADGVGLRDYVELALRGGFPEVALQPSENHRRRWLAAYVDQLIMRDASLADEHRDPVKLRRYLVAVAANTAGVVEHKTLFDAAGVTRMTGAAYDSLFELLFVTERLPAWHSNRLNRLTRAPKRYLTEPALMGTMLGVDARSALRNGDILGRLVDTYVLSQLRPEIEVSEGPLRLHHLRLDGGRHEVDLIAEAADGRIVAIEVKATAAPGPPDAIHLAWLRDQLGPTMVCGIVLHTGPRPFSLGERIHAVPISCLWGR
jgi:uncharacterized protein